MKKGKKNKKLEFNKKKLILLIIMISILVLIILLIFLSFNKISGKAVSESCTDSDNGLNYNLFGVVSDINGEYEDYCSNEKLIEAYCENTQVSWNEYNCPASCLNGVCVEKLYKENIELISLESCTDSDKGFIYNKKGSVKYCDINGKCINKEDNCEAGKLNEYYCDNKNIGVERFYNCKYGCFEGQCRETPVESSVSGGGGSGGGGSSGGSVSTTPIIQTPSYETYYLGTLSVSEVEAANNDKIKFNIIKNSSSTEYALVLSELGATNIKINIEAPIQVLSFSIGEEKNIDLDDDGANEILVKLKTISVMTNKAKLLITRI